MAIQGVIFKPPVPSDVLVNKDGTPTKFFADFLKYVWMQTGGSKNGIADLASQTDVSLGTLGTKVDSLFGSNTTDDLTEGTANLYFTDERVDDRVAVLLKAVADGGIVIEYDDDGNVLNFSFDFTKEYHWTAKQTVDIIAVKTMTVPYAAKTGAYTALITDQIINCTTGTFNLTLPTAIGCAGKQYSVKNSGTGVITLTTTAAQTIDGSGTFSLSTQWQSVTLISTGANWVIIA